MYIKTKPILTVHNLFNMTNSKFILINPLYNWIMEVSTKQSRKLSKAEKKDKVNWNLYQYCNINYKYIKFAWVTNHCKHQFKSIRIKNAILCLLDIFRDDDTIEISSIICDILVDWLIFFVCLNVQFQIFSGRKQNNNKHNR